MGECFDKGIAFVFEGDTEKYFYITLLKFFCKKHTGWIMTEPDSDTDDTYILSNSECRILVKINTVGTITQIVHSGNWFNNMCAKKFSDKMPWDVFLCYDTDSHEDVISKFHSGDWEHLRDNITTRSNIKIIDIAASADIEDVFLKDLESISKFLGLKKDLTLDDISTGRKGKARLKNIYRKYTDQGVVYHEGIRALPLIESLDMQTIIDSGILPLGEIEKSIF